MDNPITNFIDRYLAWLLVLAGMVFIGTHLQTIASGTGTLTSGAATFVKAFE